MSLFKAKLKLTCESGTIISSNLPRGNVYHTNHILPVSVLAGSLLTSLMDETCDHDGDCRNCNEKVSCEFHNTILPGFHSVSPGLPVCSNSECKNSQEVPAAPVTFEYCKSCQTSNIRYNKIHDNTLYWLNGQLRNCTENPQHIYTNKPFNGMICLNCHTLLKSGSVSLRTSVGIDKKTGASKKGYLFSYETIEAGTIFTSEVIAKEKVIEKLRRLKKIFVGRGSSRGFGWVMTEFLTKEPLNDAVSRKREMVEKNLELTGGYLVVCARTPVFQIEQDESGMIISKPYLDTINGEWELIKSKGNTMQITGWSYASNFQKPRFLAAKPGTVFIYKATNEEPDISTLAEKMVSNQLIPQRGIHSIYNQLDSWRLNND